MLDSTSRAAGAALVVAENNVAGYPCSHRSVDGRKLEQLRLCMPSSVVLALIWPQQVRVLALNTQSLHQQVKRV